MASFSLASLSGNMTCISLIIGTLSAMETLQPRAFTLREYDKVGILAIRGLVMCIIVLLIPIMILMTSMDTIFSLLGQDPTVSLLSNQWIHIFIWSVPCTLLFRVIQRFLACQNIVLPCVIGSFISSIIIHPFILRLCITYFDYQGSAISIVITQLIQVIITILYVMYTQSYVKETWNGINIDIIRNVLNQNELLSFAKLSMGGIFSLSEWWYWESICFVAGRLGVLSLCVHSVIYQLIPLIYMIPLGISIGLSVRIGHLIPVDVMKAKYLVFYSMLLVILVSLLVTSFIWYNQLWIITLFTTDDDVIKGCVQIWPHVCVYILGLYIFCLNSGILRALGFQFRMGIIIIVSLWCISLPWIIYSCIQNDNAEEDGINGLITMWNILFWSYTILNIGLITCYMTADWNDIGRKAAFSIKERDQTILDHSLQHLDQEVGETIIIRDEASSLIKHIK